jgi:hypothetical protein
MPSVCGGALGLQPMPSYSQRHQRVPPPPHHHLDQCIDSCDGDWRVGCVTAPACLSGAAVWLGVGGGGGVCDGRIVHPSSLPGCRQGQPCNSIMFQEPPRHGAASCARTLHPSTLVQPSRTGAAHAPDASPILMAPLHCTIMASWRAAPRCALLCPVCRLACMLRVAVWSSFPL